MSQFAIQQKSTILQLKKKKQKKHLPGKYSSTPQICSGLHSFGTRKTFLKSRPTRPLL